MPQIQSSAASAITQGSPLADDRRVPETVPGLLSAVAEVEKRGIVFVDDRGREEFVAYRSLFQRAQQALAGLSEKGVRAGDPVMLLLRNRLDSVVQLWACFLGGAVPVPLPHSLGSGASAFDGNAVDIEIQRLREVWHELDRPSILLPQGQELLRKAFSQPESQRRPRLYTLDDLIRSNATCNFAHPAAGDTALILFSSGSTSRPKGVLLTHDNIRTNLLATAQHNQFGPEDTTLCWAPLYHVIGLMCFHLLPVATRASQVMLEPSTLIKRPEIWLDQIDRHRVAFTGGPNIAYSLVKEAVAESDVKRWDLSCLRVVLNGGEVVSVGLLEKFFQRFRPAGLRPEALAPAYGMSEATAGIAYPQTDEPLAVCCIDRRRLASEHVAIEVADDHPDAIRFAELGAPLPSFDLRIVNDDDQVLHERAVGHIQIRGPSVSSGYYKNPAAQRNNFCDGWLRTGDLGFLTHGRLVVIGRAKEVLIIRGHNYYAHDLEQVALAVPGVAPGGAIATSVFDAATERELAALFVVLEPDAPADVLKRVEEAIQRTAGVTLDHIRSILPEALPRTPTGKIDRRRLAEETELSSRTFPTLRQSSPASIAGKGSREAEKPVAAPHTLTELEALLASQLADALGVPAEAIDHRTSFVELGIDSVKAVRLVSDLEQRLAIDLPATLAFELPTVAELAAFLLEHYGDRAISMRLTDEPTESVANSPEPRATIEPEQAPATSDRSVHQQHRVKNETSVPAASPSNLPSGYPVAIVAMAGRFPGADNLDAYWTNLCAGRSAIREGPSERWPNENDHDPSSGRGSSTRSRWGGFLADITGFDAPLFGISPHEALRMDPQQRLLLETCWEAVESGGYGGDQLSGSRTGVFVGASLQEYLRHVFSRREQVDAYAATGNFLSILANRVSYLLNLKGPSLAVDTACSSSLVALHLAVASLERGESDQAIVAGVHCLISPELWINFSDAGMLAPDGLVKVFDNRADGYVRGEGVGVVVLKPLSDAIRDRDEIHAVIRGTAINQDGHTNGLTAPNRQSQSDVIRAALDRAAVEPDSISYVEAHGTGTRLGDPIELGALGDVFGRHGNTQRIGIGSVKSAIGHLEPASGIASLLKVILSLKHGAIPPSLNLTTPNELLCFEQLPFYVVDRLRPWRRENQPRRAGVSSFGFGGTNAHVVVEEAPESASAAAVVERPDHLLALSARSSRALERLAERFQETAFYDAGAAIADICFTTNTGRRHWPYRAAFVARDSEEMRRELGSFVSHANVAKVHRNASWQSGHRLSSRPPRIAFLFAGQGGPLAGVAAPLIDSEPEFRSTLEHCDELLAGELPLELTRVLTEEPKSLPVLLADVVQAATFAFEYALCQLWRSWGIHPDVVFGHSLGEYVAACVAGVFSLEDALRLVAFRGRLMQERQSPGAMLALLTAEGKVRDLLEESGLPLDVAAVNGPAHVVVAGDSESIASFAQHCDQRRWPNQRLPVTLAFHSRHVEPLIDEFATYLSSVPANAPSLRLISDLSGELLSRDRTIAPEYWCQHMRRTVRFADGVRTLAREKIDIGLEIGPATTLSTMAKRVVSDADITWESSLQPGISASRHLLTSLGALYARGVDVDWNALHRDSRRQRTTVPAYPFEHRSYWIPMHSGGPSSPQLTSNVGTESQDIDSDDVDHWFHEIVWEPTPDGPSRTVPQGHWLILGGSPKSRGELTARLVRFGCDVTVVRHGEKFKRFGPQQYQIRPGRSRDVRRLLEHLGRKSAPLKGIVHLGDFGIEPLLAFQGRRWRRQMLCGFQSFFVLCSELARLKRAPSELWLATTGALAAEINGAQDEHVSIPQTAAWSVARVAARELPATDVRCVDVYPEAADSTALADGVWQELQVAGGAREIAVRRGRRLAPQLRQSLQVPDQTRRIQLRDDGVYLITGGLGGLGLALVDELASAGRTIVLTGRRELPPEEEWPKIAASEDGDRSGGKSIQQLIAALNKVRSCGAYVVYIASDVGRPSAVRSLVDQIRQRFGRLHGILHAAGVLDDRLLHRESVAHFRDVLRPKLRGSVALLNATRDEPLDFLILCSSATTVWGNVGQASYAAANAMLDAWAHQHRNDPFTVVMSLAWTPWSHVGMAARLEKQQPGSVPNHGLRQIEPETGRRILARAFEYPRPHYVLFALDAVAGAPRQPFISAESSAAPHGAAVGSTDEDDAQALDQDADRGEGLENDVRHRMRDRLRGEVAQLLDLSKADVPADVNLMEIGFDSIMATRLASLLSERLGAVIAPSTVFARPTIEELVAEFASSAPDACRRWVGASIVDQPSAKQSSYPTSAGRPHGSADYESPFANTTARVDTSAMATAGTPTADVAIIATACRLPSADSPEAFWRILRDGRSLFAKLPAERLEWSGIGAASELPPAARYGAFLADVQGFDASMFGVSPKEARLLDPQQRLFVEVVWETFERAGIAPARLQRSKTGVFVGASNADYVRLLDRHGLQQQAYVGSGNALTMIANRVSYAFDLSGPSLAIDTACSSSLVAVHMACDSLQRGDCEMAIAGGVNLVLLADQSAALAEAGMLSPEGRLRTFDDRANGYVRGEGAIAILLKPLAQAQQDGDRVLAIIRSSAVNHDGHSKMAVTAPNPKAQQAVLLDAWRQADVDPRSFGYIEAHGTGTSLGDPIEIDALSEAYTAALGGATAGHRCAIGSVKTNVGHLEAAAGIAGLLKTVLALEHREIPPTLHVNCPNRHILFERTPFYVNDRPRAWTQSAGPRRAGVSSFGAGGTNAHVVVEEAPQVVEDAGIGGTEAHVFTISARTPAALKNLAQRYVDYLNLPDAANLPAICATANSGRAQWKFRLAVVARYRDQLADRLRQWLLWRNEQSLEGSLIFQGEASDEPLAMWPDWLEPRLRPLSPVAREMAATQCPTLRDGPLKPRLHSQSAESHTSSQDKGQPVEGEMRIAVLAALAVVYVRGGNVDWAVDDTLAGQPRAILPTYPFERKRYWFDSRTSVEAGGERRIGSEMHQRASAPPTRTVHKPSANWLYVPGWRQQPHTGEEIASGVRTTLLIGRDRTARTELATRLRSNGQSVTQLDTAESGALREEIRRAAASNHELTLICLVAPTSTASATDSDLYVLDEIRSIADLLRTIDDVRPHAKIDLRLVTYGATDADGDARCTAPALAGVWGLARSAALEIPAVRIQAIDLDPMADLAANLDQLVAEIRYPTREPEIAYRDGRRWAAEINTFAPTDDTAAAIQIRPGGVYLVSGGYGAVGNHLVDFLRNEFEARVAVLSRNASNDRNDGDSRFLSLAADVGDADSLRRAVDEVVRRFGQVDGVFHLAGTEQNRRLADLSTSDWENQWQTKYRGAVGLDRATRDAGAPWMVLFSSVAGLLGNAGQAAYAAANRGLDAFAAWRTAHVSPTQSMIWGMWDAGGMDRGWHDVALARGLKPMPPDTALRMMRQALDTGLSQVMIADIEGSLLKSSSKVDQVDATSRPRDRETPTSNDERLAALTSALSQKIAEILELPETEIELDRPLFELGIDSLIATELTAWLSKLTGKELPRTLFFDNPTLQHVAVALAEKHDISILEPAYPETSTVRVRPSAPIRRGIQERATVRPTEELPSDAIAVIGMSGRFPKAPDLDQFWRNLVAGVDCVEEVSSDRWAVDRFYDPRRNVPGKTYSKWAALLEDLDMFDAAFFRIARREAEQMDPQQRILLEVAWEAIESAAYGGGQLAEKPTGVFVGAMPSEYLQRILNNPQQMDLHVGTGNAMSVIANRISYAFNFAGPCLTIDTACSSSLVALHLAIRSLRQGECDYALVGATQLGLAASHFQVMSRLGALSPTGRCRTFACDADGYVLGEGVAALLLKPLRQAVADGDSIRGVIRGSAIGHGGRAAGLTVPNSHRQAEVIRAALRDAAVDPSSIQYVEAHGTGTSLGDPIEVEALEQVFGSASKSQACALGSVKSNIGHLEPAAGLAGLLKVLLALEHEQLPPTLHVREPNPMVAFESTPFYLPDRLVSWPRGSVPRRAGVSSFGFGGTNAHVVVEESQVQQPLIDPDDRPVHLLTLSAETPEALRQLAGRIADDLSNDRGGALADVCYSANVGRRVMSSRMAVVAESVSELVASLRQFASGEQGLPPTILHSDVAANVAVNESILDAGEFAKFKRLPGPCLLALSTWCDVSMVSKRLVRLANFSSHRENVDQRLDSGARNDKHWTPATWREALTALGWLFINGVSVDWQRFEAGRTRRRMRLATYPYQRERYWIDDGSPPSSGANPERQDHSDGTVQRVLTAPKSGAADATRKDAGNVAEDLPDVQTWFHPIQWCDESDTEFPVDVSPRDIQGRWLIFSSPDSPSVESLIRAFEEATGEVTNIFVDGTFSTLSIALQKEGSRQVSENVRDLLKQLHHADKPIRGVLVLLDGEATTHDQQATDASKLEFVQELAQALIDAPSPRPELWSLTVGQADRGRTSPLLPPVAAAIWSLARVARLEHPQWDVGCLHLDTATDEMTGEDVTSIVNAVRSSTIRSCVLTGGRRWLVGVGPMTAGACPVREIGCPEDGAYVVTGAMGTLGLVAAECLVELGARDLVLIGRSPLPPESQWEACLRSISRGDPLVARIRKLRRWRRKGVRLHYAAVDVAEQTAVDAIIEEVRNRGQRVRGVIHCAGVLRDSLLRHAWATQLQDVMRAKATGLRVLARAVEEEPLDFFLVYSSLAAITGNVGQAVYAAANGWMAADAARLRRRGLPVTTLHWGPWSGSAMTGKSQAERFRESGLRLIEKKQGAALLRQAIAHEPNNWAIYAAESSTSGDDSRRSNLRPGDPRRMILEGFERFVPVDLSPPVTDDAPTKRPDVASRQEIMDAAHTENVGNDRESTVVADQGAASQQKSTSQSKAANQDQTLAVVRSAFARVLRVDVSSLDVSLPLQDLGVDSLTAEEAVAAIREQLGDCVLTAADIFEHPTLSQLSAHLAARSEYLDSQPDSLRRPDDDVAAATQPALRSDADQNSEVRSDRSDAPDVHEIRAADVAIIGYSGRFPSAETPEELWQLLLSGRSVVGPMPQRRWQLASERNPRAAERIQREQLRGGFLEEVERFDAQAFGITPIEALQMDPRQRIFLEVARAAIEDAGYGESQLRVSRCGVFVGAGAQDYLVEVPPDLLGEHSATGGTAATLPSRVAYWLDLRGPCMPVDTACSSSLVALHLAVESLRRGQCDTAIVGGVHLYLRLTALMAVKLTGAVSPSGTCRPFSGSADGFVPGEGAVALMLKPLEAAIENGDSIYGVIKGTAVNNDGRTTGLTAPNPASQREVIRAAWSDAEVSPESIEYVEAHGTGTLLGDPIEIGALRDAFARHRSRAGSCRIGSLKGNIGHLDAAAGLAGLLKVLLAFEHDQLPSTAGLEELNPRLDLSSTDLEILQTTAAWPHRDRPRRAGISAFGFSGTNAHVVVEEPPSLTDESLRTMPATDEADSIGAISAPNEPKLGPAKTGALVLSAFDRPGLERLVDAYRVWFDTADDYPWHSVCYTAAVGRSHGTHRLAIIAADVRQAADRLNLWRAEIDSRARLGSLIFETPANARAAGELLESQVVRRMRRLPVKAARWIAGLVRDHHNQPGLLDELGLSAVIDRTSPDAAGRPTDADVWNDAACTVAGLYVLGCEIDWQQFYAGWSKRRIRLPQTPPVGARYWLSATEPPKSPNVATTEVSEVLSLARYPSSTSVDSWIYRPTWQAEPRHVRKGPEKPTTWFIWGDPSPLLRETVRALRAKNENVVEVVSNRGSAFQRSNDQERLEMDRGDDRDFRRLVQRMSKVATTGCGVLYVWPGFSDAASDASNANEPARAAEQGEENLTRVVRLLRSLARHPDVTDWNVELKVITRSAAVVGPADVIASPDGGLVPGLFAAVRQEMPFLSCQWIDVSDEPPVTETALELVHEIVCATDHPEVALREQGRFVSRIESGASSIPADRPLSLREGGIYLITGGLGGVGRELASWLVERCQARVVLVSRRAPSETSDMDPDLRDWCDSLRQRGGDVWLRSADVTDAGQLRDVVDQTIDQFGQLDGVIHAAGTIRRGLLRDTSDEAFQATLRAKVQGSWALDWVLRDHEPDWLLLCSSVAGRIGNGLQADYSAANRFLDSFAGWRDAAGRRTVVVDWGLWDGVGMGASAGEAIAERGDVPMTPDLACDALARIFQLGGTEWIVTTQSMQSGPAVSESEKRPVERERPDDAASAERSKSQKPSTRGAVSQEKLVAMLAGILAETTGLEAGALDPRRSFLEIGLDSMLVIRFVRVLETHSGRKLPATLPFDFPNLIALASHLLADLDAAALDQLMHSLPPEQPVPHSAVRQDDAGQTNVPAKQNPGPQADGRDEAEHSGNSGGNGQSTAAPDGNQSGLRLSSGRRVTRVLRSRR